MKIDMSEHLSRKLVQNYQIVLEEKIYALAMKKAGYEEALKELESQSEELEKEIALCDKLLGIVEHEH